MASPYHLSPIGADSGCTHCNCDGPCLIGSDTFTRADADALGGDWSERSGDADIVSNQLKFITTGLVRYETAHPDGVSGNQHVDVDFKLASTSDYARVVVNYTDDSNYLYAGIEYVSSCWVLRLRQVSGGADTSLQDDVPVGSINLANTQSIKVCWNPTTSSFSAVATIEGVLFASLSETVTIADGSKVGLAGTDDTIFDNFEFWILKDATHTNCPHCETECFIGQDTFDRTDSTDIGCQWAEISGAWSIATNQLAQTGAAAGIAKYKVFHPTLDLNHYVEVDVVIPAATGGPPTVPANDAMVLVNYLDGSNYHYAAFSVNSGNTTGTLTIGKAGGSFLTTSQNWTAGTYRMVVCWDDDDQILTASIQIPTATIGNSMSSTRVAAGKFVGLGAGSSSLGNEKFDNFEFWKHLSAEEPDCPDCSEFAFADPDCEPCTTPKASHNYALDFGAAFLTDDDCDQCDQIAGEYVVQYNPSIGAGCFWTYSQVLCQQLANWVIVLDIDSSNRWLVTASVQKTGDLLGRINYAQYRSNPIGSGECQTPATLTKIDERGFSGFCSGTFPNTISLDVA